MARPPAAGQEDVTMSNLEVVVAVAARETRSRLADMTSEMVEQSLLMSEEANAEYAARLRFEEAAVRSGAAQLQFHSQLLVKLQLRY